MIIYTDGGYRRTKDLGAWAFLLIADNGRAIGKAGAVTETTNNRMELMAVVEALRIFSKPRQFTLISDSQYTIKTCDIWLPGWKAAGWRKSTPGELKNVDILKELDGLLQPHDIEFKWVRGHAGDPGNEFVDTLLNESMDSHLKSEESAIDRKWEQSPIPV